MRKIYILLMLLASMYMSAQQINGDLNENKKVDIEDVTMLIDDYLNDKPHYLSAPSADPYAVDNSRIVGTWYAIDKTRIEFAADGTLQKDGSTYKYEFVPQHGRLLLYDTNDEFQYACEVYKITDEYMIISGFGAKKWTRTMLVVNVSSITLSSTALFMSPDDSQKLTATVLPAYADNAKLVWTSSNEEVVRVVNGVVVAINEGTAVVTATAADGGGVKAECAVTVGTFRNGHEYVDLGLPSGTLWATCNVGASTPEEYGGYFAWGETDPELKDEYYLSTYKWYNGSDETMTKYCTDSSYGTVDNKTVLDPEDDAAHVNWGGDWRMPTSAEFDELLDSCYCSWAFTTQNDVYGCKVTSIVNGKSIFLPAAGFCILYGTFSDGSFCCYWSSSLRTDKPNDAYALFCSNVFGTDGDWRYNGQSVRPVCKKP